MSHHAGATQVGVGVAALGEVDGAQGGETIDGRLVGMAVWVVVADLEYAHPGLQLGQEGGAG